MKKLLILPLLLAMAACDNANTNTQQSSQNTNVAAEKPSTTLTEYKANSQTLLSLIRNKANDSEVAQQAAVLVALSTDIVTEFQQRFPNCNDYLNALLAAATTIPTLPLEEIESGYHKDGKLPALNDANCYNAKDLLVHPATVQAMATIGINSDEARQAAELEIMEVIGHFSQVESALMR